MSEHKEVAEERPTAAAAVETVVSMPGDAEIPGEVTHGVEGEAEARARSGSGAFVDQAKVWEPSRGLVASAVQHLITGSSSGSLPKYDATCDEVPTLERLGESGSAGSDAAFVATLRALAEGEPNAPRTACELSFDKLRFAIPAAGGKAKGGEKVIIEGISGTIKPGQLVALMGPSGCGKSTLLDMLADKKTQAYSGRVLVNGRPRSSQFSRLVSYVPQLDYGSGLETVRESVAFVSRMKSDYAYVTDAARREVERAKHVELVLAVLGLSKVADARVGNELVRGISGGQKRRVTLAKGIITGPSILFCDEPTSGLSSTDSETAVRALKNLCVHFGMTIVCVIHQPRLSVFNMFDQLILLSEGRCVFQGAAREAEAYFGELGFPVPANVNPADWLLDCVTPGARGADPELFVREYAQRQRPAHEAAVAALLEQSPGPSDAEILRQPFITRGSKRFIMPTAAQARHVVQRALVLLSRDLDTVATVLLSQLATGLLLGLVYQGVFARPRTPDNLQQQLSFVFILLIAAGFAANSYVPVLVQDKAVFLNERAEGLYGTLAYMTARTLQNVLLALIGVTALLIVAFFCAAVPAANFGYVWLMVMSVYLAVDALVSLCACLSANAVQANSSAGLVITFMGIFNGFTANLATSPAWISWFSYLSPFFYGFWGFTAQVYDDDAELLASFGLTAGFKWWAVVVNLAFGVLFRFAQFLVLHYGSALVK